MSRVCVVLDGMAKILNEEKLKRLERVRSEADNFIDYQLIYVENLVLEKISINRKLTRSLGKS